MTDPYSSVNPPERDRLTDTTGADTYGTDAATGSETFGSEAIDSEPRATETHGTETYATDAYGTETYATGTPASAQGASNQGGSGQGVDDQGDGGGVKDKAKDVAGTAKEQASQLGSSAADSAKNVAGTAKSEAANVAGEAKQQAKALYDEATTQLREQAGQQQTRAAKGLHGIGDELSTMSQSSEQQGLAAELVSQIASRATGVATWLESREPADVLDEVKAFARRRPVAFIALSAIAGLVAGRLVRSLASEAKDEKDAAAVTSTPTAASGTTPPPPTPGTQVFPATSGYEAAQGVPATSIDGSGQPRHAAPATFVDAPPAMPGQGTDDLGGYQR